MSESLKILSLEDSVLDFEITSFQLLKAGYNFNIYRVDTESEYVSSLRQNQYDIILADYNLPSFDAFDALRLRNEICPETPIICLSGSIGEEKAIELLKLGADDYVLKDRPDRLPFAIDRALNDVKEKDRKRIDESQLQKLSRAVEQSPVSVLITDTSGNIEYVNKKFCEITGYSLEESIGKNPRILKSGHQNKFFYENMWNLILNGNVWEGDLVNKKKNGDLYWEHATISSITGKNGEITNFLAVKEDISEHKKFDLIQQVIYTLSSAAMSTIDLNELIEIIRAELGKLLNTTNFYIAFYDEETDMLSTVFEKDENDRIETWSAQKSVSGYIIRHQQSLLAYDSDIERLLATGEIEMVGTPSKIWLGVPMWIDNRIFGVIVVQNYDNKDAYNEKDKMMLEFISEEISLAIHSKRAEKILVSALKKAEESDRLKTAFLTNLSHEIRTPMNGILGFAELLKEPELTGEQQQEYIQIIEKSGARMLNIINDIVNMSKIEVGLTVVDLNEVNVNEILESIYKSFKKVAENKGLKLSIQCELSAEEAFIQTDAEKLSTILINLLNNAFKFSETGSVEFGYNLVETLHATSQTPDVTPLHLQFFVKDTGIGIPKDRTEAIFERFVQADVSDSKAYQGAGLGLSITKAYIEMLGGTLWLESEPGRGSVFYFTLPYNSLASRKNFMSDDSGVKTVGKLPAISNLKILIVEDDKYSELFLRNCLRGYSKNIESSKTGIHALDLCRKNDFDLVLMDIKLPDKSGVEVVRQIRQFNDRVVIIAQTAYEMQVSLEEAIHAGCNDYISKPIRRSELIGLIQKHFSKV
jgi:PAS domain S-box-containing protein